MEMAKIIFILTLLLLADGITTTTEAGLRDYIPSMRSLNPLYWLSTSTGNTTLQSVVNSGSPGLQRSDSFNELSIINSTISTKTTTAKPIVKTEVTDKPKIKLTPIKSTIQDRLTSNSSSHQEQQLSTPHPPLFSNTRNSSNYDEIKRMLENSKKRFPKFPKVAIKPPAQNKSSNNHVEAFDAEENDKVVKDWKKILSSKQKASNNTTIP